MSARRDGRATGFGDGANGVVAVHHHFKARTGRRGLPELRRERDELVGVRAGDVLERS
ncbi:hypothetical protein [Arthrobacter sp. GAS37]|uniref:hypothetical protein n=1 Tax=Arthrobacter sp. GAS37 TaxID=3156261 RepID=UPI00384D8521